MTNDVKDQKTAITTIEKVTVFRTSDGVTHETFDDAIEHAIKTDLMAIREMCPGLGTGTAYDIARNRRAIIDILMADRDRTKTDIKSPVTWQPPNATASTAMIGVLSQGT